MTKEKIFLDRKKVMDIASKKFSEPIITNLGHAAFPGLSSGPSYVSRAIGEPRNNSTTNRWITVGQAIAIANAIGVTDWKELKSTTFDDQLSLLATTLQSEVRESDRFYDAYFHGEESFNFNIDLNLWEFLIIAKSIKSLPDTVQKDHFHSHKTLKEKLISALMKSPLLKPDRSHGVNNENFEWDALLTAAEGLIDTLEYESWNKMRTENLLDHYSNDPEAVKLISKEKRHGLKRLSKDIDKITRKILSEELDKNNYINVSRWHQWKNNSEGREFLKYLHDHIAFIPQISSAEDEDYDYYIEDQWSVIEAAQRILHAVLS